MAPPSAAAALRESFGDRKLPDITRKITACVACRKAKIKCRMNDSQPPCARCRARGLPCAVNKSIQALLENDLEWKEEMERRVGEIEQSLLANASHNATPHSASMDSTSLPIPRTPDSAGTATTSQAPSLDELSDAPSVITLNLSCSLGAFPASSLENLGKSQVGYKPDLISTGLISQERAEEFFNFYHSRLNPYLHHILSENDSLPAVRLRSSLLTAAVCTTAALCTGSTDYHNCLNAFRREVSSKLFSTSHTFDDIKALCIGAFWLNDISFALNALAVRIAAELNLHRCISKMPHMKRDCYDRTRLYFMVYICDHHCALSYGRPPMTRSLRSLKAPRVLLQSKFSTSHDLALISQVELWLISNQVFDNFGADIESSSARNRSAELERLSSAYDQWRQEWLEVLTLRNELGDFAQYIFDLYYNSAKLYLYSHVFRGPAQKDMRATTDANGMDIFAQGAAENALSIIRRISHGYENQVWLENLPCYFGPVTAFASILLLRASYHEQCDYNLVKEEVFQSLHRLTELIRRSLIVAHPVHPLLSIANSLEIAIGGRYELSGEATEENEGDMLPETSLDLDIFRDDILGMGSNYSHDSWLLFPSEDGPDASTSGNL